MRNDLATRHLDVEELVPFLDRELPRRRYGAAREHVGACWTCHARFAELQSITSEIVRLDRKLSVLDSKDLGDWPDLRPRLREARRSLESVAPRGWAAIPFAPRLVLAGAVLASLVLGYSLISRSSAPSIPTAAPQPAAVRSVQPFRRESAAVNPPAVSAAPRTIPRDPSSLSVELRVIQALHRIGADLGEPVEVAAGSGGVSVIAKGLPEEREADIRAALAGLPTVVVRFGQPATGAAGIADAKAPMTFTTRRAPFADALEAAAGGAPELAALTNSLLDESEEMMAAAHAWRNLTLRFPADRRRGMNSTELTAFTQIEDDHAAAIRTNLRQIERHLATFNGLFRQGDSPDSETNSSGLFDSARRLQRSLNAIFGGDNSPQPLSALWTELTAATRQMDRAVEAVR